MIYTTKTGALVLGYTQETLKWYAYKYKLGSQPGGPGTPYIFTREDLLAIRERNIGDLKATGKGKHGRWVKTQKTEDRDELGLGPFYDPDGKPR